MKKFKTRIGLYPFTVELTSRNNINECDGRTYHNDRKILIADDLDDIAKILVARHEVVHALLGTQGRAFQKKFDVEEICEFIAYKLPEINDIMEDIDRNLKENSE